MSSLEARLIDNAEVEELQNRIDSLDNEDAMDAGVMDGFLTAMAINPGSSSDEDVLPFIFSDQGDPSAIPDDARLLELIGLRRKEIQAALNAKGGLDPIIFPLVDDDGKSAINLFLLGVHRGGCGYKGSRRKETPSPVGRV